MIPLPTLYYFLCYAWNRLPEPAVLQASEAVPFHRPLGLLAQVLLHGTRRLLKAGLPRTFIAQQAELTSLRGRIELAPSLGRGLLARGQAICTFDELSPAATTAVAIGMNDLPISWSPDIAGFYQVFNF